jgi:serine/threonine-protein kinase RsbW
MSAFPSRRFISAPGLFLEFAPFSIMLCLTSPCFRGSRLDRSSRTQSLMKTSRPARRRDTKPHAEVRAAASKNGLLLKLELHSDPKLLSAVRGAVERLTEILGLSAAESRSVIRAVDEALTNIMRHCYCGRLDQPIEVTCSRIRRRGADGPDEGLEILLSDRGPAIDPALLRGRPLDEIRPGGLGLHLIRQSMDTVEYRRTRGTNQFRLVKYFNPVKSQPNC